MAGKQIVNPPSYFGRLLMFRPLFVNVSDISSDSTLLCAKCGAATDEDGWCESCYEDDLEDRFANSWMIDYDEGDR